MAKKSIQSRYSIDYVYPDNAETNKSTGSKWLSTALLMIITLGLAASFFLPVDVSTIISNFTKPSSETPSEPLISSPVVTEEIASEEEETEDVTPVVEPEAITKEVASVEPKTPVKEKVIEPTPVTPTPVTSSEPTKEIEKVVVEETPKKVEPVVTKVIPVPTPATPEPIKTPKAVEVIVEEKTIKKEKNTSAQLAASLKQLAINEELTRNIERLSQQLLAEKKKNETLNSQLNVRRNRNSALSGLLENALNKANEADKRYVDALNGQTQKPKNTNRVKINTKRARNDIAKKITIDTKRVDYNNSISVSDTVQIDAILAAMQASSAPKRAPDPLESSNEEGSTIVQIPSKLKTINSAPSDQLFTSLQNQINSLINDDSPQAMVDVSSSNDAPEETLEDDYRKALNVESAVRINEMRTIVIIKGDTLWAIAKRAYGNGAKYKKIIDANPNIVKKGKVLLLIGQVIRVPN